MRHHIILLLVTLGIATAATAADLVGRVVDTDGQPISFASTYLKATPTIGTVTAADGTFSLQRPPKKGIVMVSFLGYEVREIATNKFHDGDTLVITLKEQPIELEETIVKTKTSRRKRRLAMEQVLRNVSSRLELDMPDENRRYHVVSDARFNAQMQPVATEQMIGYVVELPRQGREGRDSIQYVGELSRRYVDTLFERGARNKIETTQSNGQKRLALQVDSGTVVHRMLWGGNIKQTFNKMAEHPRRWSISRENSTQAVLTYTETRNILGMIKVEARFNYIIDNATYQLQRISSSVKAYVNLLFAVKIPAEYLDWLNIINNGKEDMNKFKFKRAQITALRNVIFTHSDTHTTVSEKNMIADIHLTDNRDHQIPIYVAATVKVTGVNTEGVKPYSAARLRQRIPRQRIER